MDVLVILVACHGRTTPNKIEENKASIKQKWEAGKPIQSQHFPHTLHVCLQEAQEVEKAWGWEVFNKITGTEIMLAFLFTVTCACANGDPVTALKEVAYTVQVKFHVVKDSLQTITMHTQFPYTEVAPSKGFFFGHISVL